MTAHPDLGYRLRRAGVNDDLCNMADNLAAEVTRLREVLKNLDLAYDETLERAEAAEAALTDTLAAVRAERDEAYKVANRTVAEAVVERLAHKDAIATAREDGVAEGLRMAAEIMRNESDEYAHRILALIPAPPSDGPRRASGLIDPENGFATTGAEAHWIADTEAGVYDNAPCQDCGRELLAIGDHVYCPQCPARPLPPAPREGSEG